MGTQRFAGKVELMLEATHVLDRNCLGGTVVNLHVSAKHRCRTLLHSDNCLPDCNHLFVLELLGHDHLVHGWQRDGEVRCAEAQDSLWL